MNTHPLPPQAFTDGSDQDSEKADLRASESAGPSSLLVVGGDARPALEFLGETVAVRLTGADTRQDYTLLEVHTPPGGGIPVLHTHPGAETVIVLVGTYEIYRRVRGAKTAIEAVPGTVVYVPDGAPHGYANVGDTPGRLLVVADAAGRMDDFFARVGTPIPPPDDTGAPGAVPFPDVGIFLQAMAAYRFTFVETP